MEWHSRQPGHLLTVTRRNDPHLMAAVGQGPCETHIRLHIASRPQTDQRNPHERVLPRDPSALPPDQGAMRCVGT
jgi:hypothetical protein